MLDTCEAGSLPQPDHQLRWTRIESGRMIAAAITISRYAMTYLDAQVFVQELARQHRPELVTLARSITNSLSTITNSFDRVRYALWSPACI